MTTPFITDEELLSLSVASEQLSGVSSTDRDTHRATACDLVRASVAKTWSDVTAWGGDCKYHAAGLAAYSLLSRRGYKPSAGADDNIKARYDAAVAWLEKVERGEVEAQVTGTRVSRPIMSSEPSRHTSGEPYYNFYRRWKDG